MLCAVVGSLEVGAPLRKHGGEGWCCRKGRIQGSLRSGDVGLSTGSKASRVGGWVQAPDGLGAPPGPGWGGEAGQDGHFMGRLALQPGEPCPRGGTSSPSCPWPNCTVTPSHPPLSCRPTSPSCRTCSTTSSSWQAPWTRSSSTRTQSCSSCGPHRTGPRSCCTTSVRPSLPSLPSRCLASAPTQRATWPPRSILSLATRLLLCFTPRPRPPAPAPDLRGCFSIRVAVTRSPLP